jgi:hypothetical protein
MVAYFRHSSVLGKFFLFDLDSALHFSELFLVILIFDFFELSLVDFLIEREVEAKDSAFGLIETVGQVPYLLSALIVHGFTHGRLGDKVKDLTALDLALQFQHLFFLCG